MKTIFKNVAYEDNLPVHVELMEIKNYPIHIHKDLQIIFVLEGELDLKLTFTHYILQKNSIHIVHSYDTHALTSISDKNLVLIITLNNDYFSNYYPDIDNTVFTTKINEHTAIYNNQLLLREQIFSIVSEFYNKDNKYKERIIDNALSLIDNLKKHFRGFSVETSVETKYRVFEYKTSNDWLQVDRVSRITSYIYKNYPYKISLTKIAEMEKINPYYLSHLFQKFIGVSFRDFISLVRVEMSEAILLSSDISISKISQDVGFSDIKYYVQHFKNWFGYHPKEYRNIFTNETISAKMPEYIEIELEKLKGSIEEYTRYPVFKDAEINDSIIEIDFAGAIKSKIKELNPLTGLFNNIYLPLDKDEVPPEYYSVVPQKRCVEFVLKLIETHRFSDVDFMLKDTANDFNGIISINGLKKPMFYLLQLLETMPSTVVSKDSYYMATKDEKLKCMLIVNPNKNKPMLVTINFCGHGGPMKMTKYHMQSSKTYLNYWAQLNYKSKLTKDEYNIIELMTSPEISFNILSSEEKQTVNCYLEPFDIAFYRIEKI